MTMAVETNNGPDATMFATSHAPAIFDRMRQSPRLAWLGRPMAYACGTLLLTALGSGATLLAARILDPVQFGTFALLTSLFTYASRADLGMSQLADKQIPGRPDDVAARAGLEILIMLWLVGGAVFAGAVMLVIVFDGLGGTLPILGATMAIGGGILGMIANGPVTVFRAASRVWEFTVLALILQVGMTIPRLGGLLLGGVTGSFTAVAIYFALCAVLLARPLPHLSERPKFLSMARMALPLFAFNASWVFYLGANRWISSIISTPWELGLFSFGTSLATIGLGVLATIAQVRYPKLLARMNGHAPDRDSPIVEKELLIVTLGLTLIAVTAVFIAGDAIAFAFPAYTEATAATIALAVAVVPLGTMTWIVPMVIVRSKTPGRDALKLAVLGLATLSAGMALGDYIAGIDGQAWGNAVGAFIMLVAMVWLIYRLGMVTVSSFGRIVGIQAFAIILLAVLAALHPAQAAATAPSTTGWKTVFQDDFSKLDLQASGSKGMWQPFYPWNSRTNETNKELEYYVDPRQGGDVPGLQALTPYKIDNGVLAITASKIPENLRSRSHGLPYASGLLNTADRFSFTYGAVEIRARMPSGKGLWPAFWLLPKDRTWPPEIDVFEVLGGEPNVLHTTVHSSLNVPKGQQSNQTGKETHAEDLSRDFHVYGVIWTKEKIVWTLDEKPVFQTATPADLHKPMYLLLNLAVGGWSGTPDATTQLPASLLVDWIRVRQPDDNDQAKGIIQ